MGDRLFNDFTELTGTLLKPTEKFVIFTMDVLEIIIREFGPLLFEFAFDNVPVAFDIEFVHSSSFCSSLPFTVKVTAKS